MPALFGEQGFCSCLGFVLKMNVERKRKQRSEKAGQISLPTRRTAVKLINIAPRSPRTCSSQSEKRIHGHPACGQGCGASRRAGFRASSWGPCRLQPFIGVDTHMALKSFQRNEGASSAILHRFHTGAWLSSPAPSFPPSLERGSRSLLSLGGWGRGLLSLEWGDRGLLSLEGGGRGLLDPGSLQGQCSGRMGLADAGSR